MRARELPRTVSRARRRPQEFSGIPQNTPEKGDISRILD